MQLGRCSRTWTYVHNGVEQPRVDEPVVGGAEPRRLLGVPARPAVIVLTDRRADDEHQRRRRESGPGPAATGRTRMRASTAVAPRSHTRSGLRSSSATSGTASASAATRLIT